LEYIFTRPSEFGDLSSSSSDDEGNYSDFLQGSKAEETLYLAESVPLVPEEAQSSNGPGQSPTLSCPIPEMSSGDLEPEKLIPDLDSPSLLSPIFGAEDAHPAGGNPRLSSRMAANFPLNWHPGGRTTDLCGGVDEILPPVSNEIDSVCPAIGVDVMAAGNCGDAHGTESPFSSDLSAMEGIPLDSGTESEATGLSSPLPFNLVHSEAEGTGDFDRPGINDSSSRLSAGSEMAAGPTPKEAMEILTTVSSRLDEVIDMTRRTSGLTAVFDMMVQSSAEGMKNITDAVKKTTGIMHAHMQLVSEKQKAQARVVDTIDVITVPNPTAVPAKNKSQVPMKSVRGGAQGTKSGPRASAIPRPNVYSTDNRPSIPYGRTRGEFKPPGESKGKWPRGTSAPYGKDHWQFKPPAVAGTGGTSTGNGNGGEALKASASSSA